MKYPVICHKCGHVIEVDTSMCLASNPPKYNLKCNHCGYHEFIFCHEFDYLYNKYGKSLLLKTRGELKNGK